MINVDTWHLIIMWHTNTQSTHERHPWPWDRDSFFKAEKRQNHSSTSDCTTVPDCDIHNKNVLFINFISLNLVFWIERSRNFCIFVWSAERRGGRGGKTLTKIPYADPKHFVDVSLQTTLISVHFDKGHLMKIHLLIWYL